MIQVGPDAVRLHLARDLPAEIAEAACAALSRAFARLGTVAVTISLEPGIEPTGAKLRRVHRAWTLPARS